MKLLRITLPNGYLMLEKGFTIDFMTKTRVDKRNDNPDLLDLGNGFDYPIETIFIGKNSSGKTTVINMLYRVIRFLLDGRMSSNILEEGPHFEFEALFYEDGFIYSYHGSFVPSDEPNHPYLIIENESLRRTLLKGSYKKDLSNTYFPKENLLPEAGGSDTSSIRNFVKMDMSVWTDTISLSEKSIASLMNAALSLLGEEAFCAVIHLFDDSIEYIKPYAEAGEKSGFWFKRVNKPERLATYSYLVRVISSGTFRGLLIFLASFLAFRKGGTILVDEIEKNFNKNLVQNLILLFNDPSINVAKATLIYTTHYAELLDENDRVDNINVLHRNGDDISIKNLCVDYEFKLALSKSKYFDQNAFDNLANYDRLMELRRALKR